MKITASQLYNHLVCPHRVAMDAAGDPAQRDPVSPFTQLLWKRGMAHERDVIAGLGVAIIDLSALAGDAKEAATREAIARREPLIYGGRLSVDELLGEPDLLRLENGGYAAIDIKSGAGREGADDEEEGKPRKEYGVQLALYTDILLRLRVAAGRYGYILDVHLREQRYDLDPRLGPKSDSIWEIYLKARAATLALLRGSIKSTPALSGECKKCVWRSACFEVLQGTQDLTLVAELGRASRDSMQAQFPSLADLAGADIERYINGSKSRIPGVSARRLRRFQRRAALQLARDPPCLNRAIDWPGASTELFFDIETDPMRDLCYLHGFVIREGRDNASERFHGVFAGDLSAAAECDAFADAMALFRQHADATVVHYSKYERTQYRRLQERYPQVATRDEIERLFAGPRALDLYEKVRAESEWPTHDLSVKSLAKWCGFSWRDVDPSGASSIEWFDQWARSGDDALRQRLLDYNEDDCRAMRVVLDAMKTFAIRPATA